MHQISTKSDEKQRKKLVIIVDKMYAILQLFVVSLACRTIFGQVTYRTYTLKVMEDVTLERGYTNFNNLAYLIVGTHPGYPLKRSLMRFENIPGECTLPTSATLHIFFVYAHRASASSIQDVPDVTRYIAAHTVLKSWSESEATSTKRNNWADWDSPWLNLGTDADPFILSTTTVTHSPGHKWYTLDVTQQAQDWKFGSNYGLLLRDTHEVVLGQDFRFASNAYGDSRKHAYITLTCSVQQRSVGGGGIISPIGGGDNPI